MNLTERPGENTPQEQGTIPLKQTYDKMPPNGSGEGYRLLGPDEELVKGDELWSVHSNAWIASDAIGNVVKHNSLFAYRRRLDHAVLLPNFTVDEFLKRCDDARVLWPTWDQREVYDPDATLNELRSYAIALNLNTKSHERIFPLGRNKLSIVVDDWVDDPRLEEAAFNRFQNQISDLAKAAKLLATDDRDRSNSSTTTLDSISASIKYRKLSATEQCEVELQVLVDSKIVNKEWTLDELASKMKRAKKTILNTSTWRAWQAKY